MTKEEFLLIAESHYAEFEGLKASPTFYDYEKSLEGLMQKMSCQYMENHLNEGSVSNDRRKKKNSNPIRSRLCIEVSSIHV